MALYLTRELMGTVRLGYELQDAAMAVGGLDIKGRDVIASEQLPCESTRCLQACPAYSCAQPPLRHPAPAPLTSRLVRWRLALRFPTASSSC
mmetsp:Transcript_53064/g.119096  ORF Transcript_53064/g.119096 Transcript_53064/m.119096 type:complete len:92 (+) Transcript_53064:69-344(+)